MKLQEKLCVPIGRFISHTAEELEEIADEYAIDFAIFSKDYTYHSSHKVWVDSFNILGERFTSQQLKVKFKKEKGL